MHDVYRILAERTDLIWRTESQNSRKLCAMVAKLINQSGDGLDRFDRAILKRIQTDNTLSHARIGEDVGLSPSAVRRRIAILRESGVIAIQECDLLCDNTT
ncbi:MAG: AsnC family transcriptional regulator, partial [Pseudomonadota bacterium]